MARLVEVRVPDMGSFSEVAVIDVLVKPGDAIEKEASLITLETEKATMDVPSDVTGVVEKLHVTKGGKVSPGDVVATVRVEGDAAAAGSVPAGASAGGSSGGPAASTAGTAAGSAGAGSAGASGSGASGAGLSGAGASGSGSSGSGGSGKPGAPASASPAASTAPSSAPAATSAAKTAAPASTNGTGASNGASAPAAASIPGGRTDLAPINEAGFSTAHAGPSVRRFARELGVDLSQITGTASNPASLTMT